jgi:putative ABC transport system permease protein
MNDLKFAFRQLLKNPGFTAVALLTLALCVGANVVIFAVVDSVLLRPLPFREPDRLVTTINAYPKAGAPRAASSLPNYYDRREAIGAFEKTAAIRNGTAIVGEEGSPKRVQIERVTPEFFATLGVAPGRGRFFTEEETEYARSHVVVLTDAYWHVHFNADPNVIGREMRVDGLKATIVGVLPPGFRYLSSRAELFFPLASDPDERGAKSRHSNNLQLVARLKPGATLAAAQAQIDSLNAQQAANDPYSELVKGTGYRTGVFPLHADHVQQIRPTLLLLQGGVLALFLIGGVNLVNLLLIRASGRAKELAVRQALGAGRWHVARNLLVETVLLAFVGGVLGLAVGAVGIRLLAVLGIDRLPLGADVALSGRVALVTLVASGLAGVALALPMMWFNLRGQLALVLQTESRGGTVSRAAQRLRHAFIIGQVTLAFVLLVGAGLLGRSLQRVLAVSPGFQPGHVLTGQLVLPWNNYREPLPRLAFIERLLGELRAQPGVTFAGINTAMPMSGNGDNNATTVEGHVPQPGESIQAHYTAGTAGNYWQAMGVPLREGRFLEEADNHRHQRVCVVDEDFAKRYWPNGSAIGRRIANDPIFKQDEAFTIVGVVGRVKHNELGDTVAQGAVYYPYRHYAPSGFYLVVRTTQAPEAFASTLRQAVLRLDPELPVDDLRPMQARIDESLIPRRSPALLAGIFAAVALLLAAIGTYGVLAYTVTQRRREIGVRMALGALPAQIRGQFLRVGVGLLAAGLALGGLGAWGVVRAMQSVLFEVGAMPVGVIAVTAGVMIAVVLLACWLPARRAARVDPIEALRYE